MQPDTSSIPHGLLQVLGLVLASFLGWVGGWLTRRKREPHEVAKLQAETRQITVNTDVSLIQAATTAITKAERLQQERDHWELKAFDLDVQLKQSQQDNGQLTIEANSMDRQMRKQMAFIRAKGLESEYLKMDQPKS